MIQVLGSSKIVALHNLIFIEFFKALLPVSAEVLWVLQLPEASANQLTCVILPLSHGQLDVTIPTKSDRQHKERSPKVSMKT